MTLPRRVTRIVALCAVLGGGWIVMGQVPSRVSVGPGEQGVVVQDGQVARVLGPGTHQYNARQSEVTVYQTLMTRTYEMPEQIDVAGCPASVTIFWDIHDVVAWHAADGQVDAGPIFAAKARQSAQALSAFGDDPRTEMQVHLNEALQSSLVEGAALSTVLVRLGDCAGTTNDG